MTLPKCPAPGCAHRCTGDDICPVSGDEWLCGVCDHYLSAEEAHAVSVAEDFSKPEAILSPTEAQSGALAVSMRRLASGWDRCALICRASRWTGRLSRPCHRDPGHDGDHADEIGTWSAKSCPTCGGERMCWGPPHDRALAERAFERTVAILNAWRQAFAEHPDEVARAICGAACPFPAIACPEHRGDVVRLKSWPEPNWPDRGASASQCGEILFIQGKATRCPIAEPHSHKDTSGGANQ